MPWRHMAQQRYTSTYSQKGALNGRWVVTFTPSASTPGGSSPSKHSTGGWGALRPDLDANENRKISYPAGNIGIIRRLSTLQSSRYTDCVAPQVIKKILGVRSGEIEIFVLLKYGAMSPCSTQRQARELISGPDLAMGARLLSFNRTQTRVVIGLLTGHNTLRRHLHIMVLCNDPMCRKCGTEEETSVHILCECVAIASLRHVYLGSFFLDPKDIRQLGMGAIWNFVNGTGLL
jgi:hypothetical protein